MYYNWIEIFKEKSTKELYEIFCGNSLLPNATIPLAKKELERRNFDFISTTVIKDSLKLSEIEEQLDYLIIELNRKPRLPLKQEFIIIGLVALLLFFVFKNSDSNVIMFLIPITTVLLIIAVGIDYFIYKRLLVKIDILNSKKLSLLKRFDDKGLLLEKNKVIEEISNQSKIRLQKAHRLNRILGHVITIGFVIYTIIYFIKYH